MLKKSRTQDDKGNSGKEKAEQIKDVSPQKKTNKKGKQTDKNHNKIQ